MMHANIFLPSDRIVKEEYDRLRSAQINAESRRLPSQFLKSLPAFLLPLIYVLVPLKLMILIQLTLFSVVFYVVIKLILSHFCPTLFALSRRATIELGQRSLSFKCATDFVTHMKPFVLWGLFLTPPIGLLMMGGTAVRQWFARETTTDVWSDVDKDLTVLRIHQNLRSLADTENNFISTSAFTITAASFFLSGIPAAVTYFIYCTTGVDRLFGYPSLSPQFFKSFFGILLYAYSVGWCISTLFFKSYFTYPFAYTSFERELELDEHGARLNHIKGWFSQVLWFTTPHCWSRELAWNEIRSVEFHVAGVGRMSPLPDKCFSKNSLIYRFLNNIAAVCDAVVARLKPASYLTLCEYPTSQARLARNIRVNLWELDERQRLALFKTLRLRAPHAVISAEAQKELIGSVVLDRNGRQQDLLDPLICPVPRVSRSQLQPGDRLQSGQIQILAVLPPNGRSNRYEVVDSSGTKLLLKEYILPDQGRLGCELSLTAQIREESKICEELRHFGFPKLFKTFVEDRRAYLLCEMVAGRTLRQVVHERGCLSESEVRELGQQLACLLKSLHAMPSPIVHRDINPDNVILTTDNRLVLHDLSQARRASQHLFDESAGQPAFMAPEQFQGVLDVRSDLYAVGALLYFLLTGRDPLPLGLSSPLADGISISSKLDNIILRATAIEADERYDSAEWLELDLKSTIPAESRVV